MKKLYDYDQQTKIDGFGVDHSNFSLRDEIEYNFQRAKEREMQQMIKSYADLSSVQPEFNKNEFNQYNIRDDKNYAWDMPHKYDHRQDNIFAQIHNFQKINKEHPISKPISTSSKIADFAIKKGIGKINPLIKAGINAYNWGYQGAGYYDNWQRAKEAGKYPEYPNLQSNDFFLKNK